MKKQIVIINGSGGVGKDTFVNFCGEIINVTNISSVDIIKEAASLLGWDGGKDETDREFLSDLKLLSTNYNNYPYEYIKSSINIFKEDDISNLMFIHIREPEEIDKIKKEFGCVTLLIKNINKQPILTNMADANVNNYKYDYVINNDYDLDDLKYKTMDFMRKIF